MINSSTGLHYLLKVMQYIDFSGGGGYLTCKYGLLLFKKLLFLMLMEHRGLANTDDLHDVCWNSLVDEHEMLL